MTIAEILGALSAALDLVEGQPRGHALRTCLIAMAIAERLGLDKENRTRLYYASLLKDAGCSNNSARVHKIFGADDHLSKRAVKLIDWTSPLESVKFALSNTDGGFLQKARKIIANAGPPAKVMDQVTFARCTRGADIARKLGFEDHVADAVYALDEHWDGKGSPHHLKGAEIPYLARILCVAQTVEVFATAFDPESAFEMLRERKGKWFDPEVTEAALQLENDAYTWDQHSFLSSPLHESQCVVRDSRGGVGGGALPSPNPWERANGGIEGWRSASQPLHRQDTPSPSGNDGVGGGREGATARSQSFLPMPEAAQLATEKTIDQVCEAFAQIVDAKSDFTGTHSVRVAEYADAIAEEMCFDEERKRTLHRAALLHDIGKLGVPTSILDKPGKLTDEEFATVRLHPRYTLEILEPIEGFQRIAEIAAAHHERLDGTGYWRGLSAKELDMDMRVLAAADVFDALSASRPYRSALHIEEVFAQIDKMACHHLDPDCIEALRARYSAGIPRRPAA